MTTATAQFVEELAGREQLELLDIPGQWRLRSPAAPCAHRSRGGDDRSDSETDDEGSRASQLDGTRATSTKRSAMKRPTSVTFARFRR
jgi:hypothetical protein